MEAFSYKSSFINANGIRLHCLDWGGSGPALLFIPGWGCNAYIFGRFAPRFTDHFHVLGFTRRGHGDSDYPESGYDPDTLAEDLRQFLNGLGIERVILAGHSLGYVELSRFATLYPERVIQLVFLDGMYDQHSAEFKAMQAKNPLRGMVPAWPSENPATIQAYADTVTRLYPSLAAVWGDAMLENLKHQIKLSPEGGWVDKETDAISQAIRETVTTYAAPYTEIRVPLLSIFALLDGADFLSEDTMNAEQKAQVLEFVKTHMNPYNQGCIERFRRTLPQARIAVFPNGHHYCFIKQEELVFNEMRRFLLDRSDGLAVAPR